MSQPASASQPPAASPGLRLARLTEYLLLFVLPPALYTWKIVSFHPIPLLGALALFSLLMLARDRAFPRHQLWNAEHLGRRLLGVGALFLCVAVLMTAAVAWFLPDRLLFFPRHYPLLWAAVMLAYPLMSVYPQELIYRAFFFRRYDVIFGRGWTLLLLSAATFSYAHVIFGNVLAVVLTLAGGLLFAWRYRRTQSLLVTSIEHALYGQLIFTIGLGEYFYHGTIRLTQAILHQ